MSRHACFFTPISNLRFGGSSSVWGGGSKNHLIFQIHSLAHIHSCHHKNTWGTIELVNALSRRLLEASRDPQSQFFLLRQRIDIAVQKGNALSVRGTSPDAVAAGGAFFADECGLCFWGTWGLQFYLYRLNFRCQWLIINLILSCLFYVRLFLMLLPHPAIKHLTYFTLFPIASTTFQACSSRHKCFSFCSSVFFIRTIYT